MSSSANEAKSVARAFYESYNDRDLVASFETYVGRDLVNHAYGGTTDRAGWLEWDLGLFAAFEDFSCTVLDQIAEGDKVATRWTLGGTQTGMFSGVEPKSNRAFLTGTAIDRIKDGKIVEHWVDLDYSGFLDALRA
ncbi:ester cyclase [Novosphingobium sp. ST904]|uniref:ester cyclase n=1 Tax=Novosphingobium sp. ST904 TaxID=1684385 RepID=UPI0006C85ED5|nr:ester cyclase [Novosphingobium sp. ST904]TCM33185.1 putative ester cyclase [Novosphingobium sp. ST904]